MKRIGRASRLRGELRVPSDKSIGHRALMLAAIADRESSVTLHQPGADLESTRSCVARLSDGETLDCGNSGTTMRLLTGLLAGQRLTATLDGDGSLRRRPMERIAVPLRAMGADVETTDGHAPVHVRRGELLATGHRLNVASAQVLGAICLAALGADGETRVEVPGPTRDHTERLLGWLGVPIRRDGLVTTVAGPARPRPFAYDVPGDPSSAAAWIVAATLHPDAELTLTNVCLNPTRLGFIGVLRRMGARIELREAAVDGPEPVGDISVRSAERLEAVEIAGDEVADLIDELPLLAIAMAAARGSSQLRDAGELRVKESDRIASVVEGLDAVGAEVDELPDGWRVSRGRPRDAAVATHGDHRIAMAFAIAALTGVAGEVRIDDADCASVSYPTFWDDLEAVSMAKAVPA
ncbi:MAG TPA: 3-phosphoshikimate 1-carboxyvinyltransferase [Candidatus Limnocylindria bacterium]|nr:3-phosphoshikimate 1-carboxyvinyltransferase [Candidatus Limnocylindria bacterium]